MILVTGGAGFIGSNLVAGLEDEGVASVAVCDSLGTRKVFIGGLLLFSLGALISALS